MEITALAVSVAGLIAAAVAIWVAVIAIRRSDRNASAATLVALYEALRAAWQRYLDEVDASKRDFAFAELINLFELACAVLVDKCVHGAARELLDEYVVQVLSILAENDEARSRIAALRDHATTFKYLKLFMLQSSRQKRLAPLSAIVMNTRSDSSKPRSVQK